MANTRSATSLDPEQVSAQESPFCPFQSLLKAEIQDEEVTREKMFMMMTNPEGFESLLSLQTETVCLESFL